MVDIMLLELVGPTRLVFLKVGVTRFCKMFDEAGNGGAMEVKPACNLMIRLANVFELNNPSNLAWGSVDHSVKE